jgi:hypothetical protein
MGMFRRVGVVVTVSGGSVNNAGGVLEYTGSREVG